MDARSNFVKATLKTYQFVDKLVFDLFKLVESFQVAESSKEANDSIVEELA